MRHVWTFAVTIGFSVSLQAQPATLPVFGDANPDNSYSARYTEVYSFDFETATSDFVQTAPSVVITSNPNEVIGGKYSLKLSGPQASVSLRPGALHVEPGKIYLVQYDYRILVGSPPLQGVRVTFSIASARPGDTPVMDLGGPVIWTIPKRGTDTRGMRVPADQPASPGWTSINSVVVIDNIHIFREDAAITPARLPILNLGFPRLLKYALTTPDNIALQSNQDTDQIKSSLAQFDLLLGTNKDHTMGDGAWIRDLRTLNPNLLILPYQQSFMSQYLASPVYWGVANLQALYNRTLREPWFMHSPAGQRISTPKFPVNVQMNQTPLCPLVGGQTYNDHLIDFLAGSVFPSGLWDGLHFDQAEWYPNPLLLSPSGALPPIDLAESGIPDTFPALVDNWRLGFEDVFSRLRKRLGNSRLLFGNTGYVSNNATHLRYLNGWLSELTSPYGILPSGDWYTNGAAGWYQLFHNYQTALRNVQAPVLVGMEFTGEGLGTPNGAITPNQIPNRYPQLERRDYQRMRLGLTTVLLGEGFFGYDYIDNTTAPVWFDEYAVDSNGAATSNPSGKGYLGQPLGDAKELSYPVTIMSQINFDTASPVTGLFTGPIASITGDPAKAISGLSAIFTRANLSDLSFIAATNPAYTVLQEGTTYAFDLDYRMLDYQPTSFTGALGMGFADAKGNFYQPDANYLWLPDVDLGQIGHLRSVVRADQGLSVRAGLLDLGSVAIDNLRLSEGGGGVWRRDFENGVVLVNPTPDAIGVGLADIQGPLDRTGLRRIRGTQDAATNNGQAVTGQLQIPAADGIILLADPIPTPVPTAPTQVTGQIVGTQIQVAWNPSVGSVAGYYVRYGEDPFNLENEEAVSQYHSSVTLSRTAPGITYFFHVAAYDYLGRLSPFSSEGAITIPGSPPDRPVIFPGADTPALVVGDIAELWFENLSLHPTPARAELTGQTSVSVLVNGVAAPILAISGDQISFQVPWQVSGDWAVVRVVNAQGIKSAGLIWPVLPALPRIPEGTAAFLLTHTDSGQPVTADNPALGGETLQLRVYGLGLVKYPPEAGSPPPSSFPVPVSVLPDVTIEGVTVHASSAVLDSVIPGAFLLQFQVPGGIDSGPQSVSVAAGGYSSESIAVTFN